ncbi:CHAD domain-containing protein [Acidocella sp.]|jgi:inorganic triphosphatase YgiF|uniref:CYTH and CHAD domain-containing protein n=1 Tax=Acidocella sp. TaxID=50710 RepID=UPI002F4186AD
MTLGLALTERGAKHLDHHPELRAPGASDTKTQHLLRRYYDTSSYDLARAGLRLCVTRSGNMIFQTMETTRTSGVAMRRDEWEWELQNDQPDFTLLTAVLTAKPLPPPTDLQEISVTDLKRVVRTLHLAPDTIVRASFDEGTMEAGATVEPVRDLQLELLNGEAGAVYRLALRLHAENPLSVMIDSPAARGFRRAAGKSPSSQQSGSIKLSAASSGAEAFARLVAACLNHLLVNQPAALAGSVEGIHQMRVAIRRLRALLALYKPALDPRRLEHFDKELKRIGRIFGQARDWDVFCTELLPQASRQTDLGDVVTALKAAAEHRRHATREAFMTECRSQKFTATVLELAAWVEAGRFRPDLLGRAKLAQKLQLLAPRWLDRLARKVKSRGQNISRHNNTELHELRKSIKKLRYGIEFTESLFPLAKTRPYQKRCKALQETLGLINDSFTSVELARTLVRDAPIDLPALSALAEYQKKQRQSGLDDLTKTWKAFRREKRFWS